MSGRRIQHPGERPGRIFSSLALVAAVSVCLAGCGGASKAGDPTATSRPSGPSRAKVTALTAPASVACNGSTSTTVAVNYTTAGAVREELYVDGRPEPITAAGGTVSVAVHCDALPHSIVVIAYDAQGRSAPRSLKIETVL